MYRAVTFEPLIRQARKDFIHLGYWNRAHLGEARATITAKIEILLGPWAWIYVGLRRFKLVGPLLEVGVRSLNLHELLSI